MRTLRTLAFWPHLVTTLVIFLLVTAALAVNFPSWWASRGVLKLDGANQPIPPDDYAALNQGQLKNIALAAFRECEAGLPGGAGPDVTALLNGFTQIQNGQRVPKISAQTDDFAAATLGQLKAIARPFYDRFEQVGLGSFLPWPAAGTADDYAVANLGQAKAIFNFDLSPPEVVPPPNPVEGLWNIIRHCVDRSARCPQDTAWSAGFHSRSARVRNGLSEPP